MNKIVDFLTKLKIVLPENSPLMLEALTHPSYANEVANVFSYQRLEFLGDALIDAVVTEYIFNKFPQSNEGELTALRANMVSGKNLAQVAIRLGLNEDIRFGKAGIVLATNENVLADVFEAVSAAIYLLFGHNVFLKFIKHTVLHQIKKIKDINFESLKSPRSLLQEMLQLHYTIKPTYITVHQGNEFMTKVMLANRTIGKGSGAQKKLAEAEAAKDALAKKTRWLKIQTK